MEQDTSKETLLTDNENQQKQFFAEMDKKQKIEYIFTYYKWHMIGVIVLVFAVIAIGKTVYHASLPTVLNLAFINNNGDGVNQEYVVDAYREYYDLGTRNHINLYCDFNKNANGDVAIDENASLEEEMAYYAQSPADEAMAYAITATVLDAMICDEEAMELYVSAEETTAIDNVLPEDIYKQIEDKVVIKSDPNKVKFDGEPYSVAIDVSDTEFIKNCNLSYDKAYLVIPSTRKMNDENTVNFINFIFDLQARE